MKTITLTFLIIFTTIALMAQSPQAFQYQAIARDASGNILADQAIGIKVNILQGNQDVYVDETTFPGAKVGIGVTNPGAKIEVAMQDGFNSIFKRVNNNPNSNSLFLLRRARGSLSAESAIVNGDYIGQIGFDGSITGGGYNRAAVIAVKVDGTPGSTIPGYMEFRTRDGSGVMNKNMVIDSEGKVGIGTSNPNQSAILELNASNKGFLPPRMTESQMNAMADPAEGLMIYCTDCVPKSIRVYNGCHWVNSDGSPLDVGSDGNYWSSSVSDIYARSLDFGSGNDAHISTHSRAGGFSVRCIKD